MQKNKFQLQLKTPVLKSNQIPGNTNLFGILDLKFDIPHWKLKYFSLNSKFSLKRPWSIISKTKLFKRFTIHDSFKIFFQFYEVLGHIWKSNISFLQEK